MKKITAIFFLALYLFSATEAHQLLKLPVVFQHFKEHQKEDKNITLLQFLDMHYMHGIKKDKDYDRDMELPFKTSNDCISTIATAFVPLMVQYSIAKPIEIPAKKNFITHDQFIHSSYLSNIWQPPKSC